ncbi:MAG: flagellar basal body P-ring formation chaperone FlgA [Rhodocyclaceae bacterium]
MSPRWLVLWLMLPLCVATAEAYQDPFPIRRAVEDFLRVQVKGLPGTTNVEVGQIDTQNSLAPCNVLEPSLLPGTRAWGRTTVLVRCREGAGWSLYVPTRVRVMGEYFVAARALVQGAMLTANDLLPQRGDLTDLPPGTVTDATQALGRSLTIGTTAGRPLRSDMLRQPYAVLQGQSVKIISSGNGFRVSSEGRALNNATDGQVAQVRTGNGQTLSGIARLGGIIDMSH